MELKCTYCGKEELGLNWPNDNCCWQCREKIYEWECVASFGEWEVRRKDRTIETNDKKYFRLGANAEGNARLLTELLNSHHVS
jgi:hypothetical protein